MRNDEKKNDVKKMNLYRNFNIYNICSWVNAGTTSLLKWKGVMFASDDEKDGTAAAAATDSSCTTTTSDSNATATNPTRGTEEDFDFNGLTTDGNGHKVNIYIYKQNVRYTFSVYI